MAGNPRIDDLRRRLERDPGSRLFAQLAEELRKDGDVEEAINVCREGLKRQPAYPSARMTLGRALFDGGDLAAARSEFETVLKGAPDNILASRLLAESLEGLGDLPGAARQYRTTLALVPGDKQVQAHLEAVEQRLKAGGPSAAAPAAPPPAASVTPATIILAPPSPPPPSAASAATVRAPRPPELASDTSPDKLPMPEPEPYPYPPPPPPVQRDYAPIPLVAADETFELEAAHESPATRVGGGAGAAGADWVVGVHMPAPPEPPAAAPAAGEPFPMPDETIIEEPKAPPAPEADTAFELEQPYESPVTQWSMPSPPPARVVEEPARPAEPATDFAEEFVPPAPQPRPIGAPLDLPPLAPEPPAPPPPPPAPPVIAAPAPIEAPPPEPPPPVEAPPAMAPPAPPAEPAPDLSSATLGELYFNQGFTDKALDVYRQLVEREPGNERARARMAELEALERHLRAEEARGPQGEPAAPADPAAARRKAIERTIARLEAMLAAVKKEQP